MLVEKDLPVIIANLTDNPKYAKGGKYRNWLEMEAKKEGVDYDKIDGYDDGEWHVGYEN